MRSVFAAVLLASVCMACGTARTNSTTRAICKPGPTWTPQPVTTQRTPLPPDTRSDAERMAEIDAAHQRAFDYVQRFIDAGCDPRAFPQAAFSHVDGLPPQSLEQAVASADVIVTGPVSSMRFTPAKDDPLGAYADATLSVELALKGAPAGDVAIRQLGTPSDQTAA